MHHEVELGVVIGKNGRDIPKAEAESYIAGYSECTLFDVLRGMCG